MIPLFLESKLGKESRVIAESLQEPSEYTHNVDDIGDIGDMTTRYTQDEWVAMIDQAQKSVPSVKVQYKAPNIGTLEFAKTIDHTLLKLDATKEQIDKLCEEARKHDFKVHLSHLSARSHLLSYIFLLLPFSDRSPKPFSS